MGKRGAAFLVGRFSVQTPEEAQIRKRMRFVMLLSSILHRSMEGVTEISDVAACAC